MEYEYRVKTDQRTSNPTENPKDAGRVYKNEQKYCENVELQKRTVGPWETVEKVSNEIKKDSNESKNDFNI